MARPISQCQYCGVDIRIGADFTYWTDSMGHRKCDKNPDNGGHKPIKTIPIRIREMRK